MPFIKVMTNAAVSDEAAEKIKSGLGKAITAIPGKSEYWLMVDVSGGRKMWFQGNDEPCALAEVNLYGSASGPAYQAMTEKTTAVLSECLGVSTSRIYVKYEETEYWGMGGRNF